MNNATKKKEKQFVYIVGPARSGSTITMFMLCDHPELVVWPQEIGFYTQFVNDFPKGETSHSFDKLCSLMRGRLDEYKEKHSENYYSTMDYTNVDYDQLMAAILKRRQPRVTKEAFLNILLESFHDVVYGNKDGVKYYVVTTKTGGIDWTDHDLISRSKFIFLVRHPWRCYEAYKTKMLEKETSGELSPFTYPNYYFYYNVKRLAIASKKHNHYLMHKNCYFIKIEDLKKEPKVEMEKLCRFLDISYADSLLNLTCVGKPFKGHFGQQDLNVGKIINKDSKYPELEDYERYVLNCMISEEELNKYDIKKETFSFILFFRKMISSVASRKDLMFKENLKWIFYLSKSIFRLRIRIALDGKFGFIHT